MLIWTIICLAAGFIGGKYWGNEVTGFFGNVWNKITNK
jgi:hypothetical protein